MPPSTIPTLRQQRLGAELRKLRERAGLSSTAAAGLLGGPQARISNIEAGRYSVSADRVRTLARNYSCSDSELVDALADMTGARKRGWWEEYRELLAPGLLDLAEAEHHATAVRIAVLIHMPGLLETVDHARATFRAVAPPYLPHEVEHLVSHRIKRQAILYRDRPTQCTALVHEAALRMRFGSPATAREQLEHLVAMSRLENVTIMVIPFDSGFPGSGLSITYVCGPVPQLDTVVLDTDHGCEFLDAEAQLTKYRAVLDRLQASALEPARSRDFIRDIARNH